MVRTIRRTKCKRGATAVAASTPNGSDSTKLGRNRTSRAVTSIKGPVGMGTATAIGMETETGMVRGMASRMGPGTMAMVGMAEETGGRVTAAGPVGRAGDQGMDLVTAVRMGRGEIMVATATVVGRTGIGANVWMARRDWKVGRRRCSNLSAMCSCRVASGYRV